LEYFFEPGRGLKLLGDKRLKDYLESTSSINVESLIIGEWNMNVAENIYRIGNYRFRPNDPDFPQYQNLINTFDENDEGNFYTNATDADVIVDGGFEDDGQTPIAFRSIKDKEKMLYSLEDCFDRFRPRSGINKLRYFENQFSHHSNIDLAQRPRFYMSSKDDKFKYWTSYRTENGIERGIANKKINGANYIDDACPFIVYKEPIPANKLVIKMQTKVGTKDLGPFKTPASSFDDPFFGNENQTTPTKWKIQYLEKNNWVDAISFFGFNSSVDQLPVIGPDGYVEISYGLKIPEKYKNSFIFSGEISSSSFLPVSAAIGSAFLVKSNTDDLGIYHIFTKTGYETFVPFYGWQHSRDVTTDQSGMVTDLTSPKKYVRSLDNKEYYREFQYIQGIRVVAELMNKADSTLDIIEMSPRLTADFSDKTTGFSITKPASDLGVTGMPVGQLLASTGSLSLFDYDQAFNTQNALSIVHKQMTKNLQIKFYEIIRGVDDFNYHIPIKTMYVDGFPELAPTNRSIDIPLRDLMFYFESLTAPELLIQNASLSYAVSLLLDSVGFSNYIFKRNPNEDELIIPFFYVGPDTSVAEALQDLAVSAQAAMFFDEENNFVMMSKGYILPSETQRSTDMVLYGSKDSEKSGIVKNSKTKSSLTNIIDLNYKSNDVFNDGLISYKTRYIQRTIGSLKQASNISKNRSYVYAPSLLWEISGEDKPTTANDEISQAESWALAAAPLNSDLSADLPTVRNGVVVNNTMDVGEGISYFVSRYNGYVYANGEVIRYDAVQFNIPQIINEDDSVIQIDNNVWITSIQEYQNYFSKLSFNGKIYPTGLIRIYSEPEYETVSGTRKLRDGSVAKHGRGQFGTQVTSHAAGAGFYWSDKANVRGCNMNFDYLTFQEPPSKTDTAAAGVNNSLAEKTTVSSIVKNFFATNFFEESNIPNRYSKSEGNSQSSALSMVGPAFTTVERPNDFISYVYKPLDNSFKHFGTRMRIIGKIENSETVGQSGIGSNPYFWGSNKESPDENISVGGTSGGLAVMVNPETNVGYYFEIIALSENNVKTSDQSSDLFNIVFYKIKSNTSFDFSKTDNLAGNYNGVSITSISNERLTLGGQEVSVGERILLQGQTEPTQNGYYIVTSSGSSEVGDTRPWSISRDDRAVPIKLWSGLSEINVDSGLFITQRNVSSAEFSTAYDLAVEYQDLGNSRKFFLYINDNLIAAPVDEDPLPVYNNMALFIRGSSKCMFENVYAIANNYSQNTGFALNTPVSYAFGDSQIDASESLKKYAISGMVQSTYLSGLSPNEPGKFNMYFEEFGTILREAAYLKVRYDRFPALYATIAKTFSQSRGYTISGFNAGSYGAEFLIFNATNSILSIDSSSAEYLRIIGITFTQESEKQLTVDDYFNKKSDFSNPVIVNGNLVSYPKKEKELYQDIKNSRTTYGRKEFVLNPVYVQTQDDANNLMAWMVDKVMKPKKSIAVKLFGTLNLQLGDIVKVDYQDSSKTNLAVSLDSRFVVYNIEYSNSGNGPEITAFLSEVV
jgi:hypothetical protein